MEIVKKALVSAICIVILTLASTPSAAGFVGPGPFGGGGSPGFGIPFGGGWSGPFGFGGGWPGPYGYGSGFSGPYGYGGGNPYYGGFGGPSMYPGYGYPGPLGLPGYSGFGAGNSGLNIGIDMPGIGSISLGQFGSGISAGSFV